MLSVIDASGEQSIGSSWIEGLDHREQATVGTTYDHADFAVAIWFVQWVEGFVGVKVDGAYQWLTIALCQLLKLVLDLLG